MRVRVIMTMPMKVREGMQIRRKKARLSARMRMTM